MSNTALITGASTGIGLELAKIHSSKGGDLVLVARNERRLAEIKAELENRFSVSVLVINKDLSIPDSAQELYDEIRSRNIRIDYLINNAGFGDFGLFADADWKKISQMIDLNIGTLTHLTKLFLPDMLSHKQGRIMNVSSIAAYQPGPLMAVYYATKAYVLNFSEAVNNEVSNTGVTITALCPGPTSSGFKKAAELEGSKLFDEKNLSSAQDVASYGYEAMMKGKAVAVHGFKNKLLTVVVRFMPRSLVVKVVRKIQAKE